MSDSEAEDSTIGEILRRLGCGEYVASFEAQKISIEQIEFMTDDDFQKVGLHTIGMRLKIKQACRNFLKGNPQSQVVDKFRELSQTKKKRRPMYNEKRNINRNEKPTRRLYVGWKHQTKVTGSFKVVSASKGGGQQALDVRKESSFTELVKLICDCYFPNGYSKWQDLSLNDVKYFIGNFTGEPVPTMDGEFTFYKYLSNQASCPVRLYLHTETVNGSLPTDHEQSDSNESFLDVMNTDMVSTAVTVQLSTAVTTQPSLPSTAVTTQHQTVQSSSSSDNYHFVSTGTPTVQLSTAVTTQHQTVQSSISPENYHFVSTGTPTVQLSTAVTTQHPTDQSSISPENYHFVSTGTPTVQMRLPRRNLSLSRQGQSNTVDRINSHVNTTSGTENLRDVVEVLDSEDEELQMALLESLNHSELGIRTNSVAENVTDILKTYQQETVTEESVTKLLILRSNILDSALKGIGRKAVNFQSRLYIKFSGEIGEDLGGPRREFFRLVMKALQESRFFDGPETGKIFTHSLSLLEKGHYRLLGKLLALSLSQDGPGLHFLSSDMYDLMVGKKTQLRKVDNLLPEDTKTMIQQLRDADNFCKEDSFLVIYGDLLMDMGIPNVYQMARKEKEALEEMIKKHHIYYRISAEISQFTSGMNDVNKAWDMITSHADLFKPIFCFKPKEILGEDMLRLFKVNYSEPGSNNRALEDVSIFGWESFLQSIEDGDIEVTFSEVLAFVTGADHIPPCGFSKWIDVDFYTSEGRLPSASTCALQLWLPRVTDPDMVSTTMFRALKESYGFLKV